ncbi:Cocaine- and amphetamine-regulated transcript protein [Myotis davidii]|uniref:Cocaine-and amphetamine-regulated transcript protein n=1 Tax=Myotis davidii TaxID=225400 RepID=L5LXM9_MYODS|nr:Cocaine- and amphetamine-regulated transcript protein [Myotis davidii]
MESTRFQLLPLLGAALLLLLPLLGARAQEDAELQPRALDIFSTVEDASHEKELGGVCVVLGILKNRAGSEHLGWARSQGSNFGLSWAGGMLQIEALQEVLKKLKSKRIPLYEKKYGQVPMVAGGPPLSVYVRS